MHQRDTESPYPSRPRPPTQERAPNQETTETWFSVLVSRRGPLTLVEYKYDDQAPFWLPFLVPLLVRRPTASVRWPLVLGLLGALLGFLGIAATLATSRGWL